MMEIKYEKKAYFPGETVNAAVCFQLNQAIPASVMSLSIQGSEKASLKTFLYRTRKDQDEEGKEYMLTRKFYRM